MSVEKAVEIVGLMKEVNNHKFISKTICEVTEDGVSRKFISSDVENIPEDLKTQIDVLRSMLDSELIDSKGNHSATFFNLNTLDDVVVRVFESDSFGPLIVGVKLRCADWWITYG